jgi:hypothetical protein
VVEGITRAASTYSMPSFLAVQAFQGYQAGGWKQAGENLAISYVTGKAIQFGLAKTFTAAGKLLGNSSKETFELAKFNQARQQGEALVKNLQRTEGEVIRLRVAMQKGERGAAEKLKQALTAREAQAAAIHENMHAKNFLKYKGDYHTRKIFTEDLDLIHQKTQEKFHAAMQARGWSKTPLKEFRNASSAGTSGMDYDIGLDEQIAGALTKKRKQSDVAAVAERSSVVLEPGLHGSNGQKCRTLLGNRHHQRSPGSIQRPGLAERKSRCRKQTMDTTGRGCHPLQKLAHDERRIPHPL